MAKLKDITPLVLTFVNHRTPELRRAPNQHDPDGATLELWLKYEGAKKYRWQGRASMDAGKLAEALAVIKDDSQVILRLPSGTIPCANHPALAAKGLGEGALGYFYEVLAAAHELARCLSNGSVEDAPTVAEVLALRAAKARTFAQTQDARKWAEVATKAAAVEKAANTAAKTAGAEAKTEAVKAAKAAGEALREAKNALESDRPESQGKETTPPRPTNADLLLQVSNQRWTLPGVLWYESDDA